ncbi:LysM peptidoglycan-binding domain-containing protein [Streptomyces sp. NBC_01304]|uniref:LysM peptidoglycan-binding domain-containing protein n=1 Tax=Streptomyces sp. NBC_01304 TaxID=2903818 RepID=UPI002E14468F|nr:LysM peptidoglycan-binding domain-containing protein [Streptomyces sp. NBC_01304]
MAWKPSAQMRASAGSHAGPMGFGNGPVITACVMAGGAVRFAGWGLAELATSDGGFIQALQGNHAPVEAPGNPGEQNAGGGSAQQPREGGTGKLDKSRASQDPASGRGDADKTSGSGASAEAKPYTIKPGDTLTAISGTTGVPIGILAETNKIQNPDLIYAEASLLIPPV